MKSNSFNNLNTYSKEIIAFFSTTVIFLDVVYIILIAITSANPLKSTFYALLFPAINFPIMIISDRKKIPLINYSILATSIPLFQLIKVSGPISPSWLIVLSLIIGTELLIKNKKYRHFLIILFVIISTIAAYYSGRNNLEILFVFTILSAYSFMVTRIFHYINNLFNTITTSRDKEIQANKTKSLFLSNMSHEIRTPLNVIMGSIELLKNNKNENDSKQLLKAIELSSESLLTVVNDILDVSNIETGKLQLELNSIDIKKCCQDTKHFFELQAIRKGISLTTSLDNFHDLTIIGDQKRIKQVLMNLINNAIKFTTNGYVKVHLNNNILSDKETELTFCVEDSGIGIPLKNIGTIFNSFTQVDSSNSRKYDGTGLGLSICKKVVNLMGGNIWVTSEEGKGSKFYFKIKVDYIKKEVQLNKPLDYKIRTSNKPQINQQDFKVLIVEDHEFNQLITQRLVSKLGFDSDIAINGLEAVKQVQKEHYDIILMDIQMPVMDGVEATKKIKQLTNDINCPTIIALTANVAKKDSEFYLNQGMDDFLGKPIEYKEFSRMLNKWTNLINTKNNFQK